eukprot:2822611-Rhodomonas_salina.1
MLSLPEGGGQESGVLQALVDVNSLQAAESKDNVRVGAGRVGRAVGCDVMDGREGVRKQGDGHRGRGGDGDLQDEADLHAKLVGGARRG